MIEANPPITHRPPTADEFAAAGHRRTRQIGIFCLLLALAVGGSFVAFGLDSAILPIILLIIVVTFILLWNYPRTCFYVTFAATCLIEVFPTDNTDALTDQIPFFWNVNTIFQTHAHLNFKGVPLNLFEVFVLLAGICSLTRAVFTKNLSLRAGPLFWPIVAYIYFVAMGWANGLFTGGDFKISLQEVRSQFYFLLAYLLAVNMVDTPRKAGILLWTTAICVGIKGILYTFRQYVTLGGMPLPDQGVGSHEEAFFFDAFIALLLVLLVCGRTNQKRLQILMWLLLPLVVTGNIATNRRAGTAALIVMMPILLLTAYCALPKRRKVVGTVGLVLSVAWSIYYPAFRNSDSMFAQPARAVKSNFQPDARDASSNAARDAENANLMATIKAAPIQGYGYGKAYLYVIPMADISANNALWNILPHNQILWVWMRVGTIGFFTFWIMIAAICIYTCTALRDEKQESIVKVIGIFSIIVVGMMLLFGALDLGMSNFRITLFTGFWTGIAAIIPSLVKPAPDKSETGTILGTKVITG